MTEAAEAPHAEIAGFWRRFCAFLLDAWLLAAVGLVVGYLLFDQFVRLGIWGRLLGFPVEVAYFGVLNSAVTGGRTPGKRLLNIKVVDAAGDALAPKRAAVRAAVLALPFTVNSVEIPVHVPLATPLSMLANVIALGGMGAIVYLFVMNRRTRQSLHDLVVGSFVVRGESFGPVPVRMWKGHLAVVGLGCAAILAVASRGTSPSAGRVAALQKAHRVMQDLPLVQSATVSTGTAHYLDSDETRFVKVHVLLSHDPTDRDAAAAVFAREIVSALTEAAEADQVIVVLTYGYDIGIAHWTHTTTHAWTPSAIPRPGPSV